MAWKGVRPSRELDRLRGEVADLEAYCAVLKGALAANDLPTPRNPRWRLRDLPPQENVLVGLLLAAYPEAVHRYDILDRLPCQDRFGDPMDRQVQLVSILICKLRKAVGPEAVETVRGIGYRLSDAFARELKSVPCEAT